MHASAVGQAAQDVLWCVSCKCIWDDFAACTAQLHVWVDSCEIHSSTQELLGLIIHTRYRLSGFFSAQALGWTIESGSTQMDTILFVGMCVFALHVVCNLA